MAYWLKLFIMRVQLCSSLRIEISRVFSISSIIQLLTLVFTFYMPSNKFLYKSTSNLILMNVFSIFIFINIAFKVKMAHLDSSITMLFHIFLKQAYNDLYPF